MFLQVVCFRRVLHSFSPSANMGRAASQKRVRGIVFLVKKEAVGHELNHLRAFHKRRRRVNEATPLSLIYGLISAVCEVLCIFRAVPVNSALPDVSDALCDLDKKKKNNKKKMCFSAFEFDRHFNVLFAFLSHCKDSISVPFQTNTFRSFTQRRNLYLEEQRKVGVHVFRHHISCRTACTVAAC